MEATLRQSGSAVVVAHPDDEALWLSSAVASAERVVFCFGAVLNNPGKSQARRRAVAALPGSGIVNLDIPESGVDWKSYLARPALTPSGIGIAEPAVRQRYEGNFARLLEGLRPVLVGCREVYTHNPWGEYGHAEHIQVYRAVTALQDELGYTVWFSNYVGPRNFTYVNSVAGHLSWTRRSVVAPDVVTARTLMRVYRGHRAWTWTSGHRWPEHEVMYAHPPGSSSEPRRPFSGEWLLDTQALRSWLTRWRRPWRLLDPVHQRRAQRPFD